MTVGFNPKVRDWKIEPVLTITAFIESTLDYACSLLFTGAEINKMESSFNNKCSHIKVVFVLATDWLIFLSFLCLFYTLLKHTFTFCHSNYYLHIHIYTRI